jgi:uncharacterized membrane protein HdeD (DUF308 family)
MLFADMGPATVAVFIPVIFVLGGIAVAITAVIVNGKKKELEHREKLAAMEKGLPLPEPAQEIKKPSYSGRRAGGLVILGFGLALTIGLSVAETFEEGVWGLLFIFVGIGLLIAAFLDKREYEEERAKRDQAPHGM